MAKKIGKQQNYGMNGKPMMKGKMPPKGQHMMPGNMPMKDSEMKAMVSENKKKKKGKKKK